MAMADGGELIVMAPGVNKFGEDPGIDSLIRQVGLVPVLLSPVFVRVPSVVAASLSPAARGFSLCVYLRRS